MSVVIRLSSETKLTFKINVNPNDFHFYSLSSAISKVRRIILKYRYILYENNKSGNYIYSSEFLFNSMMQNFLV